MTPRRPRRPPGAEPPRRSPPEEVDPGFRAEGAWPRWLSGPGAGGAWKSNPEDFRVEELAAMRPSGRGEHQWLRVEKVGLTTIDVVHALAAAAGVPADLVGYAGLKDREARTVQDFTVEGGRPIRTLPDGMRIVDRARTDARLRVGQLAGNRFSIRVRGGDAAVAAERLGRLAWMPNYYGAQRVGRDAPVTGRALVCGQGPRLRHRELKFALSAYQSLLFNRVLAERGDRRLDGDLDEDGVPTGPMYGPAMRWPRGEARRLEEAVLGAERLPPDAWTRFGKLTQGTRRKLWVAVDARLEPTEDGFWLHFSLPPGSYATVLLEELL